MLDKIILGLLQFSEHSAYSLQKAMQQSTGFFYGASQGNINPTLKRLLAAKLVKTKAAATGKRKSVLYALTKTGQGAFDTWLKESISVGRVRDDALVKLFFMGQMDPADIQSNLSDYCEELNSTRQALTLIKEDIHRNLTGRKPTSSERFRLETLNYGIDFYEFNLHWYKNLAAREAAQVNQ
tara:strand:+ start:643 stop:1188 length:546 start_codon:yes stop_codon:yes gene_type:complete